MKLLHFSDDPAITLFEPRPVRVSPTRPPGREWLNGPLVWSTDEPHAILYLFPRDCPRIVVWPTPHTTAEDRATWMGPTPARAVAYLEAAWMGRLQDGPVTAKLCRMATSLQNTRFVKSADPELQQDQAPRHHAPNVPGGEVSKGVVGARSAAACKPLMELASLADGQNAQLRGH